jgi:hypothetical protein
MGTGGPLSGDRAGRDADHSPSSSAEVKMSRSYTSPPPWRLHGVAGQTYITFYLHCLGSLLFQVAASGLLFGEIICK